MEDSLNIIPEVLRLHLINVGPWKSGLFEFSPRINVVQGQSGCGKSFILRALMPTANTQSTARFGSGNGTVTVEYERREFRYELPATSTSDTDDTVLLSQGQESMRLLRQTLQQAISGCCLLIEDDIFGSLDSRCCAEAVERINAAECQSIIVLPRSMKPERFRSPRVFECAYDSATESSTVRVADPRAPAESHKAL